MIILKKKKNPWKSKQPPWQMAPVNQMGSARPTEQFSAVAPRWQAGCKAVEDDMSDVSPS